MGPDRPRAGGSDAPAGLIGISPTAKRRARAGVVRVTAPVVRDGFLKTRQISDARYATKWITSECAVLYNRCYVLWKHRESEWRAAPVGAR